MREIQLKRQGYLWRFATTYGPMNEWTDVTDICTYWRAALGGVLLWFLAVLVGMLFGASLGDFFGWLIAGIMEGFVHPELAASVVLAVFFIGALLATLIGCMYLKDKSKIHMPVALAESYHSWKAKTCVKVTLV